MLPGKKKQKTKNKNKKTHLISSNHGIRWRELKKAAMFLPYVIGLQKCPKKVRR